MTAALRPTLYLIDDDPEILAALSWLAGINGVETETYDHAEKFLTSFDPGLPGCVLSDINMPEISGIELHNHLRFLDAALPVILITGYANVPLAVTAMKQGVFDFIEKPVDNQILLNTIAKAFQASLAFHEECRRIRIQRQPLAALTRRESDVCHLVVRGFSSKVIAEKLEISQKTVESHRANIMRKTGARSLADLIALENLGQPA